MTEANQLTNPYVGPRTFTYAERQLFFGREREARDLLARVVSERVLLFYAQSGAGKSSLLHTRLIPQLREEEGFAVLPVGRVSGELPAGVDAVENIYLFNLMASLDQSNQDPQRLAQLPLQRFLAKLASDDGIHWYYAATLATPALDVELARNTADQAALVTYDAAIADEIKALAEDSSALEDNPSPTVTLLANSEQRYVLIIDQFEEIITTHAHRRRAREIFFHQLNQALLNDPNLWVVLTLREDYVAALDPYAHLMADKLRARFYMERMGVDAALDAVKRPAAQGGRPFTDDAAAILVDNLRQVRIAGQEGMVPGQYVEPVQLQVVCYQLWEKIKGRQLESITGTDLPTGYIDLSLTDFYDNVLKITLNDPSVQALQRNEGDMKVPEVTDTLLRQWFSMELITSGGIRNILLRDETSGRTGSLPNVAVDRLERLYLVRAEVRSGRYWVELIHDRFVNPILKANELYITSTSNNFASYDIPQIIQKASEKVVERYTITPQIHKRIDMAAEETNLKINLFSQMAYISMKGIDWLSTRLEDTVTWLAYLLSNLPNRFTRLIRTIMSSIWALMTLIPSGVKQRSRREEVTFNAWLIARLECGAFRVIALLFQISDLIGLPELFTIFWRAIAYTRPLNYFEIIALTQLLGPDVLRYQDVRIAEGGIVNLIFKLDWFRRQKSFTLFHTINLMNNQNLDFRILLFELTQVIQYERIGSVYLIESAIADLTTGYGYGGQKGLRQDQSRGKQYKDYNRLQQAKIVEDYFSTVFYGQDASVFLPLIDEFRAGKL